ncbi:MAG: 50S ribosomal protein L18 [Elusimicrobiales bacterium]
MTTKQERYEYRKARSRNRLCAAGIEKPRLSVYRSLRYLYAQIVDDNTGKTLAQASTLTKEVSAKGGCAKNVAAAKSLGETIAKKAIEAGVKEVRFDRGGRIYHGRIKALADGARAAGLKF